MKTMTTETVRNLMNKADVRMYQWWETSGSASNTGMKLWQRLNVAINKNNET